MTVRDERRHDDALVDSGRGWSHRAATVHDRDDQARLFNACFGKAKDARTFVWKYDDNPDGSAISRVAVDPDDGRVVGGYSYVPRRFRRDGEPLVLMQASDAMTDEAWRGKGIFTGLDDAVAERAADAGVPWAYAYSGRLSLKGFLRNGWECLGHAPLWRRCFRSRRALGRLGRISVLAVHAAPLVDVALGWRTRATLRDAARTGDDFTVTRAERFDERVDALFDEVAPRAGLVGERSARWLDWRYVDNPTGRQEVWLLERGERLDGYLVAEFVDGHAYLVDHLARDGAAADRLVGLFVTAAAERGMHEATALHFDHAPIVPHLRRWGLRSPRGRKPFRDVFPWIVRACAATASERDRAMDRWHLVDGDRDAEHMSP